MSDQKTDGSGSIIPAAVYGAIIALILGYGGSYLFLHFHMGMLAISGKEAYGRPSLMRAGVNLYAAQHSLLATGKFAQTALTLPLTVWAMLPALSLMVGGYAAAKLRRRSGRMSALGTALFAGLLYTVVLWVAAPFFHCTIQSSALVSTKSVQFNPPDTPFTANRANALVSSLVFGAIFTWLGALAARRNTGREISPGQWWVCGKAIVLTAIIVQLLFAGAIQVWLLTSPPEEVTTPSIGKIREMLPMLTGLSYLSVNGANVVVRAQVKELDTVEPLLSYKVNLLKGAAVGDEQAEYKRFPILICILALVVIGLAYAVAGWRAVKSGSRDGSLPTAARITIVNCAYIGFLMWVCRFGWTSANFNAIMRAEYANTMLLGVLWAFVASFIGAHASRMCFNRSI